MSCLTPGKDASALRAKAVAGDPARLPASPEQLGEPGRPLAPPPRCLPRVPALAQGPGCLWSSTHRPAPWLSGCYDGSTPSPDCFGPAVCLLPRGLAAVVNAAFLPATLECRPGSASPGRWASHLCVRACALAVSVCPCSLLTVESHVSSYGVRGYQAASAELEVLEFLSNLTFSLPPQRFFARLLWWRWLEM